MPSHAANVGQHMVHSVIRDQKRSPKLGDVALSLPEMSCDLDQVRQAACKWWSKLWRRTSFCTHPMARFGSMCFWVVLVTVEDHGPLEELIDAQQAGIPLSLLLLDKLKARFGTIQDVSLDENHATIILGKFARSDPMLSSQAASSMKSSGGLTNRSRQVQMKFDEIYWNLHKFALFLQWSV